MDTMGRLLPQGQGASVNTQEVPDEYSSVGGWWGMVKCVRIGLIDSRNRHFRFGELAGMCCPGGCLHLHGVTEGDRIFPSGADLLTDE